MTNTTTRCFTTLYIALVGEPSPELRKLALRLSQSTHPLFLCSTGTQALELKLQQQPCLWLIHGQLPDISGHECARLLAALRPFDRFVLIRPHARDRESQTAQPVDRTLYIHQVTTDSLFQQLRQILDQMQLQLRQTPP